MEVGFQLRRKKDSAEMYEPDYPWQDLSLAAKTAPGAFRAQAAGLTAGREYEYRAVVKHPLLTLYGVTKIFRAVR